MTFSFLFNMSRHDANLEIDEEKCLDEPEHNTAHEHHDEEDDTGDVTKNQL